MAEQLSLFDAVVEIPLTRGKVARVSPHNSDLLDVKWFASVERNDVSYATRWSPRPNRRLIHMHRVIMERQLGRELMPWELVDHIDGNGLNNLDNNIRLATNSQNQQNKKRQNNNSSGYKGVGFNIVHSKWQARIKLNGRLFHLGFFDTAEEAYAAYCKAALELHGEFARFG